MNRGKKGEHVGLKAQLLRTLSLLRERAAHASILITEPFVFSMAAETTPPAPLLLLLQQMNVDKIDLTGAAPLPSHPLAHLFPLSFVSPLFLPSFFPPSGKAYLFLSLRPSSAACHSLFQPTRLTSSRRFIITFPTL